jgi:hypothetical protein
VVERQENMQEIKEINTCMVSGCINRTRDLRGMLEETLLSLVDMWQ